MKGVNPVGIESRAGVKIWVAMFAISSIEFALNIRNEMRIATSVNR